MSPKDDFSGRVVIWPVYIDASHSRSRGRLIPKKLSIRSPKLEEIERAAKAMGLSVEAEPDAAHPSSHWERCGRLWVSDTKPKSELCRDLAVRIKEARESKKQT